MVQDLQHSATHMAREVLRMLRPYDVAGARKVRVGRLFDGGYVMLDLFDGITTAYSLGINDDVSWDLDVANRGIEVFQYDHTIERLPQTHPLFHWQPRCISGVVDAKLGTETLENLIRTNKHDSHGDMLLKCDIEGSEWLVLAVTPNCVLRQFRQIVIEMHNFAYLAEHQHADNVRRAIANLTASHRVVHVHANNFAPFEVVGGIPVPAVLELTLARIDQGEFVPSQEIFPTAMDMPCHSGSADLYLGRFTFD